MTTNTPEPVDLFEEVRAVIAEASRLLREGGSDDERTAHLERKARVMAALEAQASLTGDDERGRIQRATDKAKDALRARGALD